MKTRVLITVLLLAIFTYNGVAQEKEKRFGFELDAGASFATNKLDDAKLSPGFGFEGIFHYRFMDHAGIYAGWGWNILDSEESFAGNDVSFEETGYVLGLQFKHPFGNSPVSYFLRGAALYNHIEVENSDGNIIMDSGHGFGWQAAAGVDVPLGKNWSLTPGVKFNSLKTDVENEGVTVPLDLNYISVKVGILKAF